MKELFYCNILAHFTCKYTEVLKTTDSSRSSFHLPFLYCTANGRLNLKQQVMRSNDILTFALNQYPGFLEIH